MTTKNHNVLINEARRLWEAERASRLAENPANATPAWEDLPAWTQRVMIRIAAQSLNCRVPAEMEAA